RMRTRLGQLGTHAAEAQPPVAEGSSPPVSEEQSSPGSLDDLMVQAEIFLQYSLQPKAVERLQRIAGLFPGEEKRNQRLRNLYQLANWWPEGSSETPSASSDQSAA